MKKLFTILTALFVCCGIHAQTLVPFGGTRPIDTAYAARSLRVDSVLRVLSLVNDDTTKVISANSQGKLVLVSKGGSSASIDSNVFTPNYRVDTAKVNIRAQKQNQLSGTGFVRMAGATVSYDNSTYTPIGRILTINGTAQDLSVNRSWTITTDSSRYATTYGVDTAKTNIRGQIPAQFNPIAGDNITLSGSYPNITINASGGGQTGFEEVEYESDLILTKKKGQVIITDNTTIHVDSSVNGDIGLLDVANPGYKTMRLDGTFQSGLPRSDNDMLCWINVANEIKFSVVNHGTVSGVYQSVPPPGSYLTFTNKSGGFTGSNGNYALASSLDRAVSEEYLSGEGYLQFNIPTTNVLFICYSENDVQSDITNTKFATWYTGGTANFVKDGAGIETAVSQSCPAGIGRLGRNASNQIYMDVSTDGGSTFTNVYTYPSTNTDNLYVKIVGFSSTSAIADLTRHF